jgi:hypothetical protein
MVFLKDIFISNDLFRVACDANGDFLYDAKFNGNVSLDCGGDVGHVAFFKSIEDRDRVFEPVNMPQRNTILGFDFTKGGLGRRVKGLL